MCAEPALGYGGATSCGSIPAAQVPQLQHDADKVRASKHANRLLQGRVFRAAKQRRPEGDPCECLGDTRNHVQEEGGRVAEGCDVARPGACHGLPFRNKRRAENQKGHDAQRMRLAEPAVLEDSKTGETGQQGRDDVDPPCPVAPGNVSCPNQGQCAGTDSDEADGCVNESERCK